MSEVVATGRRILRSDIVDEALDAIDCQLNRVAGIQGDGTRWEDRVVPDEEDVRSRVVTPEVGALVEVSSATVALTLASRRTVPC